MGLVGGPHCLVMCAAPCSVVTAAKPVGGGQPVVVLGLQKRQWLRTSLFHLGRIAAYALLGGIAAVAMESLAWLTSQTTALQRLWTLMHVAVMAWGLAMVVQARQPAWLERAGRSVWARVQPWVTAPGGSLAAGFAWALMPCGLLYSAVLVAALSGGAWQGALSMAAFAVGGEDMDLADHIAGDGHVNLVTAGADAFDALARPRRKDHLRPGPFAKRHQRALWQGDAVCGESLA